jgi:RNA polymerase sigma factor (sigma-70 family)
MVLRVCRRALQDKQVAEDACQATFMVLMRKADTLRQPEQLAGWLHGVACRVALKAREVRRRRFAREQAVDLSRLQEAPARPAPQPQVVRSDLDDALNHLPAKYREAMVLCYYQGKTSEEAARLLHCGPSAVKMRLSRGREMLRVGLVRRGVVCSAAGLSLLLAQEAGAAAPSMMGVQQAVAGSAAKGVGAAAGTTKTSAVVKSLVGAKLKFWSCVAALTATVAVAPLLLPPAEPPMVAIPNASLPKTWSPRPATFYQATNARLMGLAYSPDGKQLAISFREAADADHVRVKILSVATGEQQTVSDAVPNRHLECSLSFSPDGKLVAVETPENVSLVEAATGKRLDGLEKQLGGPAKLRFLAKDRWVGIRGGRLETWTPAGERKASVAVPSACSGGWKVTIATDGNRGVWGDWSQGRATLWDLGNGTPQVVFTGKELAKDWGRETIAFSPWGLTLSPDGKLLAAGVNGVSGQGRVGVEIQLWQVDTRKRQAVLAMPAEALQLSSLEFSPDGKTLVAGGAGVVGLWDVATGKEIAMLPSAGWNTQVAISPDGKSLAVVNEHKTVSVWDWKEKQ